MTIRLPQDLFTKKDLEQIRYRGVPVEEAIRQIALFRNPPAFLTLDRPCLVGDGILVISSDEIQELVALHGRAAREGRVQRFIPASGAASRMFRDLLYYQRQQRDLLPGDLEEDLRAGRKEAETLQVFLEKMRRFAFADDLEQALAIPSGSLDRLARSGPFQPILDALLSKDAMDYSDLPKGLLKFHAYTDEVRTPLEEHMIEAAEDVRDDRGTCRLHFTVSIDHLDRFRTHLDAVRRRYETRLGVRYEVTFSVQKPSTDTLSLDMQGHPARNADGSLLFRPSGHGALIENVQDLKADLLIVKNIDNVAEDRLKPATATWSRVLVGLLVKVQQEASALVRRLWDGADATAVADATRFLERTLHRTYVSTGASRETVRELLERPIRICGMVANRGEPGGGPFWVRGRDGSLSLQIVERMQIDPESLEQQEAFGAGTHFNPVFMALGLQDGRGRPFDLERYVDSATAVITVKSSEGRDLKVLERPGLWNGAMAGWNTIFVELPIEVFNPVKTVVDLLRTAHQGS